MDLMMGKLCEEGTDCEPCWDCEDRDWCATYDMKIFHGDMCDDCEAKGICARPEY